MDSQTDIRYREMARNYLNRVLIEKDWTKADLARITRVAPSTFTRTIQPHGKTNITPKTLFKVADASNVPLPKELLMWVNYPEQRMEVNGHAAPEEAPEAPEAPDATDALREIQEIKALRALKALKELKLFTNHRDVPLYSLTPSDLANGLYKPAKRGYTERPTILSGIEDARALIVPDETMKPVFATNHIVETNPARVPRVGDDVVVTLDDGDVAIRRLEHIDEDKVALAVFQPRYSVTYIERHRIRACEPIAFVIRP